MMEVFDAVNEIAEEATEGAKEVAGINDDITFIKIIALGWLIAPILIIRTLAKIAYKKIHGND